MKDRWQLNFPTTPVSPWNFFFFFALEQFQPMKLLTCVAWKAWLLRLNIGIMHRRSNHRGIPRDRSEAYDMAVKTLTDLTSVLSGMHVHTLMQPHSCEHTHTHPCTWNPRDRLFYQCSFDWHLLSWVFFKPPTLKDTTMQHCRIICDTVIIKTFFLLFF